MNSHLHRARDPRATRSHRLGPLSEAIAGGRSLQEITRAAAGALEASLLVADDAGTAIAVAARSPADERALLGGTSAARTYELRREDRTVGRLLLHRADPPPPPVVRVVRTLIAAEVERHGANDRAARAEEGELAAALLRGQSPAAAREHIDLMRGGAVLVARVADAPRMPAEWEARLLLIVRRAAATGVHRALATVLDASADAAAGQSRIAVLVPIDDDDSLADVAVRIGRRLFGADRGNGLALGYSRRTAHPPDFHRAGQEANLAASLARPGGVLGFAETGTYRLLLPFARSDSSELWRFYRETVGPLVDHDTARGTELVATLETFLESDASPVRTAGRLLTHRHTVRYRLGQIRELTGLELGTTRGRERLGLGLKAMRVLAVWAPAAA
jgi:PucR C-terminal helix-turn-helix domain